jgi:hypothetical protein
MSGASYGDVLEVVPEGSYGAVAEVLNVYQFKVIGDPIALDADLLEDVEELLTAILTIVKALVHTYQSWSKFRVRNITKGTATLEQSFASPIVGTGTGDSFPQGAAGLVVFKTAHPRVQLRKFIGVPATQYSTSTGYLSGAGTTILEDFADLLLAPIDTTLTTYAYGHQSPVAETFLVPTTAVVTNNPAYQRRRRPGTGS